MPTRRRWLLKVTLGARSWLLSDQVCAPVDGDDEWLEHAPLLTLPEVEESLNWLEGTGGISVSSVKFRLLGTNLHELAAQGLHLHHASGELSRWEPGTRYATRETIAFGPLAVSRIPNAGQAVEAAITIANVTGTWPMPTLAASAETLGSIFDDHDGRPYPQIFGYPGALILNDGTETDEKASASFVIPFDTFESAGVFYAQQALIAGHHVLATEVKLYSVPDRDWFTHTVTNTYDELGQPIAVIDLTETAITRSEEDYDAYVTGWNEGGHPDPSDPDQPLRGLGTIARQILRESGVPVDESVWGGVIPIIDRFALDGQVDEEIQLPDWAAESLIALLPNLYLLPGPHGVRPVFLEDVADPDAFHLVVGENCQSTGDAISYLAADALTSVRVNFAYRVRTDEYKAKAVLGREQPDANQLWRLMSPYAQQAHASTGQDASKTLETDYVYDRDTAIQLGRSWLRWTWGRAQLDPVVVPQDQDGPHLRLGASVWLTDEGNGRAIRGREGRILTRRLTGESLVLGVVLPPAP